MLDLLFVVLTLVFFVANAVCAYGFDRLMGGKR